MATVTNDELITALIADCLSRMKKIKGYPMMSQTV